MTRINEDQPCFFPHKASVSLKHTSVSSKCLYIQATNSQFPTLHFISFHAIIHTRCRSLRSLLSLQRGQVSKEFMVFLGCKAQILGEHSPIPIFLTYHDFLATIPPLFNYPFNNTQYSFRIQFLLFPIFHSVFFRMAMYHISQFTYIPPNLEQIYLSLGQCSPTT